MNWNFIYNAFKTNPKQRKLGFLTQFFPGFERCIHYKTACKLPATSDCLTSGNLQKETSTGGRQNGSRIEGKANPSLKILRKGSQPLGLGDELLIVMCRLFWFFSDQLYNFCLN